MHLLFKSIQFAMGAKAISERLPVDVGQCVVKLSWAFAILSCALETQTMAVFRLN